MEYESTTKNVLNTSEEEAPKKSQNPEEPKVRNNPNTEVKPTGTSSPKEKPPAGTPENKPPQKSKASKANTKQNYTAEKIAGSLVIFAGALVLSGGLISAGAIFYFGLTTGMTAITVAGTTIISGCCRVYSSHARNP